MTRRLLLGMLAFAAVLLALLVIPLGIANQRAERDDLTRRIERDAVAAAALATDVLRTGSPASGSGTGTGTAPATTTAIRDLGERLERYARDSDARVVVVDAAGASIVDTGEAGRPTRLGRDFTTRPEVAAALAGDVTSGQRGSDTLGHPLLYVAVPVASGGDSLGAVRVSYPAEELDERIRAYWLLLLAVSFAVLGVAAIVGLIVAAWIARPLDAIARVARDIGDGHLDSRADEDAGPPEVRVVAQRLNESIDAVQRMLDDQRRFTADASHQLRTPLHALTLRLDNVAAGLAAGDAATAAIDVDKAAAEVERLAGLVEGLLVLERAERLDASTLEQVELARVAEARAEAWRERAARSGVEVDIAVPEGLIARARVVHVEQVLDNFVDNAITVSAPGQRIRVNGRTSSDGSHVELHVVDEGPGLDDEQLEAVFQRFHSGADRPIGGPGGGFGLGLAIVRRLAQVDGGSAELRHGPGRGIDAIARWPVAPSAQPQ